MALERLQKLLARAGVSSRRGAEKLIADGRVRVNGRVVTEMGVKVDPHKDKVEVNGRRIAREKPAYYVFNKPRKVVTTMDDPEGRESIGKYASRIPERVFPVGRLDYHTSGVLLLTNDGTLAQSLLKPKAAVPKVYVAKIQGHVDVEELDALRNGVQLDDGYTTKKAEVFVIREEDRTTWLQITLTEGKNRQIHRMLDALDRRVMRLSRVSFAGVEVGGLKPGEIRPLAKKEREKLEKRYLKPYRLAQAEEKQRALEELP